MTATLCQISRKSMPNTIITPTLDASATLAACLNASMSQPGDFEHLFVDGGSQDGTREMVLSTRNSRVRLIDAPGSSIYGAQNVGIQAARGDWIYVIGADDVLAINSVDRLMAALAPAADDLAYARVPISISGRKPHFASRQQSWVYRRALLLERGGFPGNNLPELDFNQSISGLPHIVLEIAMCQIALGGASSKPGGLLTPRSKSTTTKGP